MRKFLATMGLFALLALPTTLANAACCDSCNPCNSCNSCDVCGCSVQCVTIPKKHFWNLKRKGYYSICPCMTGGAAPVCPTKIGECVSPCVPSKMVIIPKKFFWEHDRCQRMPITSCDPCCKPSCDCCK